MHSSNPTRLDEGMREGDLCDLVLPLISVDEYQSKISKSQSVVIGFYVHDQDAASDLNRFLQKSAVPLLDTDVSPAPDQHGFFMVFVELMQDERVPANVADILAEIETLVGIDQWQMRVRGLKHLMMFSEHNMQRAMKLIASRQTEREVVEFLEPSALDSALLEDGVLVIEGAGERFVFSMVDFERIEKLLEVHNMRDAAIKMDMRTIARSNRLTRTLGEGWHATVLGNSLMLHRNNDPRGLLLRR